MRKTTADLTNKQALNRGRSAWDTLEALAVAGHEDCNKDASVKRLLMTMINQRPDFMKAVVDESNIERHTMTPSQTQAMLQTCQLSITSARHMRSGLNKINCNPLASERQLRVYRSQLFDRTKLDIIKMKLQQNADTLSMKVVVRYKKLLPIIEETIGTLEIDPAKTPDKFNDQYVILLSGDKGGTHTKFYFAIPNLKQERFYTHMYCMYEGTEDYNNMKVAWSDHYKEEVI